jgi:L-ornithine Nalpha-acyltransferase
MLPLTKGHYTARIATTPQDLDRAQALRHRCFITNRGLVTTTTDADTYDTQCQQIVIEDTQANTTVCTFRLMSFPSGAEIFSSYSAQFYDLTLLSTYPAPMAELGRFCIHPNHPDPDILRLAWGALTTIVDATATQMLFGCSSFDGANPARHQNAFAQLNDNHLAPTRWQPAVKSPHAFSFVRDPRFTPKHPNTLPPLLRIYLSMGGWVSDHAVIDESLNTLHVFTGLEIAAIPPNRARLLRSLAT